MAEVFSKSWVFSQPFYHHYNESSQINPIKCSVPVRNQGRSERSCSLRSDFHGLRMAVDRKNSRWLPKMRKPQTIDAKMGLSIGKAQKWWEKGLQPNMKEISSAQDLVDSLLNAGDKLVIIDFFSPGCGGCRALHPKICQLAEMNPDVQFLQVNYEDHKSMCYSLNVHVLPFFRLYRGAEGRLCSFSCTNATIKKFKDALAKHSPERCSLGPPKGLEEKELLALSANKDLSFTYTPPKPIETIPVPSHQEVLVGANATSEGAVVSPPSDAKLPFSPSTPTTSRDVEEKTPVTAGR